MNFLKGVFSIRPSFRNTGQPGRINFFDKCFKVVDRCTARRHLAIVETRPKSWKRQTAENYSRSIVMLLTWNRLHGIKDAVFFSQKRKCSFVREACVAIFPTWSLTQLPTQILEFYWFRILSWIRNFLATKGKGYDNSRLSDDIHRGSRQIHDKWLRFTCPWRT